MSKIRFVRVYCWYGSWWADVVYKSDKLYSMPVEQMPNTAKAFINDRTAKEQYDKTLKRYEYIYD